MKQLTIERSKLIQEIDSLSIEKREKLVQYLHELKEEKSPGLNSYSRQCENQYLLEAYYYMSPYCDS